MARALAGYIVQRVSGEPFDDYIEQHIFEPLGMAHSTFRQPLPANLKPLMSEGYMPGQGQAVRLRVRRRRARRQPRGDRRRHGASS